MDSTKLLRNSQIIILGLCIAGATIASSFIISKGLLKLVSFQTQVLNVTGSAQKDIKSDYLVWCGEFWRREPDAVLAYKKLQEDLAMVKLYLTGKGLKEEEILVSQITTKTFYKKNVKGNDTNEIEGYELRQSIEIRSREVDKVAAISRQATELIDQGLQFESYRPEYFYTGLDELKVEMLGKATENAKVRASQMAGSTGNHIGLMRSAKMGVFQITPINSTEISDWGVNDTSSMEKKVTAVVSVTFSLG